MLLDLTEEQRKTIARDICREIEASETAKGTLPDRWKRNEDIYHLVPGTAHLQAVEGMEPYEIALARPKIDRVVGTITSSITGLYPWVQVLDADADGENDEDIEKFLHQLAKSAGFETIFKHAVRLGCLTNIGVIRVRMDTKKGALMEWIHPSNMVCYPAEFGSFRDAKTVGHRFKKMVYKVKEQMTLPKEDPNAYYQCDLKGGDPTRSEYEAQDTFDLTQETPFNHSNDEFLTLYEVYHVCDIKGEYKPYRCVVAKETQQLLACEDYPYTRPNYFEIRLDDAGGRIWSDDSLAQALQGVQLLYSDTMTLIAQGSMMAAFPLVVMSGGALNTKAKKYSAATLLETSADVKVQSVDAKMNIGALPAIVDKCEEVADSIAQISRLGTTQNLPSGTTATAAQGLLQAQQEAKDQYTESVAPAVAEMFEFLLELTEKHFDEITQALGKRAPQIEFQHVQGRQFVFEVTGKSGASNPQLLLQKLQFLREMAMDPASNISKEKVDDRITQALDLPFSVKGLLKDGPSTQEMKAILIGVISGEISPDEALMFLQGGMNEAAQQGGNQPPIQESAMGVDGAGVPSEASGTPPEPSVPSPF